MSEYKQAVIESMCMLAEDPKRVFVGYNTVFGSRMYGTLTDVDVNRCLETPVAENLMMGLAMGMSLEGYKPVVCFERHDFILAAADAIINHLDKLPELSGSQFDFPVIIRAIVGHDKPLDPGPQHTQDYTKLLIESTGLPIYTLEEATDVKYTYDEVSDMNSPVVLVEYKRLY